MEVSLEGPFLWADYNMVAMSLFSKIYYFGWEKDCKLRLFNIAVS